MILIVDTSSSKTLSNKAQCDITVLPEIPSTTMDDNESVYLPQQNLNLNGRNVISISGFDEKSSSYLLAILSCHAFTKQSHTTFRLQMRISLFFIIK